MLRFHFVRADHVLNLRQLLERLLPEMRGLTSDEKDPEEFLAALFKKLLFVKPFLIMRCAILIFLPEIFSKIDK